MKRFKLRTAVMVAIVGLQLWASGLDTVLRGATCEEIEHSLVRAYSALDRRDVKVAQQILSSFDTVDCTLVLLLSARLSEATGSYEEAGRSYEQYAALAPNDARGFAYFGSFLIGRCLYPQAEIASQRAFSLDPRLAETLLLRGRILGLKGDATEAIKVLTEATRLAPNNPEIHYQLGVVHDGRQQSYKAAVCFEKVVKLTPDDPRAYDYLALSLEPAGNVKRTEWAYRKGLSLNRGPRFDAFLDYNYGRFLMKQNRLTEAKKHLDRAVNLTPQARSAYYERSKLNLKLGNLKAARDDAERAQVLKDPGGVILDLQVNYLLARIHRRLGDHDEARRYAELSRKASVPLSARQSTGRGVGR